MLGKVSKKEDDQQTILQICRPQFTDIPLTSLEHLMTTGIMRPDELALFHRLDERVTANKWFLPLVWAGRLLARGLEEGRVRPQAVSVLMKVRHIRLPSLSRGVYF